MAFGKPSITTPGSLELRPVAQAVRNTRERIEALEAAVTSDEAAIVVLQRAVASGTSGSGGSGGGSGTGTVTSVGASVPSFLSVSGVPITSSGTITIDLATQDASTVFAGPVSGADAAPTFRALQWNYDIPLITTVPFTSGLDGAEAVLVERYGVFHWVTAQDIANLSGSGVLLSASKLVGRGSASGSGYGEEITLGTGLSMSGTTLSATTSGTAPISPDTPPTTADPADDEFTFGTSIDTTGSRFTGATAWTWTNQGAATATVAQGNTVLSAPASATRNMRIVTQPVSGSAWRYRCKMTAIQGNAANFFVVGFLVRNSGSGRMVAIEKVYTGGPAIEFDRFNSATSFNAVIAGPSSIFGFRAFISGPMYFELELAAGVLTARYSDSGVDGSFITYGTETVATFISSIDQIGLFSDSLNSAVAFGVFDWFRRFA